MSGAHRVPALVVGGGIGGLATALALATNGQQVHLIERAEEFGEIGAGLQFGPNASRALDALGVLDDVVPAAVAPTEAILMDAISGDRLTTLDLGPDFVARFGYPYLVLHRHDLLQRLVERCRRHPLVGLETNRHVVDVEIGSTSALLRCADGSSYETPALIAADGLHSTLRSHVVDDEIFCSGYVAYRGTVPAEVATHTVAPDAIVLWIGPGIHLMQYPVRNGELYNQVAVFRSERFRQGFTEPATWGGPDELDAAFAAACSTVRGAVAQVGRVQRWPMYDRAPASSWSNGPLVLTGDAAHPMLQYLGQGACQALEDAVELGYRFRMHTHEGMVDVRRVYEDFEHARQPRTARCQTSARPWGDLWHTDDPTVLALRNRVFSMRASNDYHELDWLYGPASPGTSAPALTVIRPSESTAVPAF
ncbi:FAD-dependent monooxygenase [Nocardia farcinica]|uniref:FAD-dependent monooxygenase n=1 Tax=Nocardia farcinica TaxID=37329 RepID=UPI0022B9E7DA|nr:FAD-dependent monooxygenase [Nocardia farcinica]MCZ9328967.1 FAD-dependent monooxygenase [Nocardia farcinica]